MSLRDALLGDDDVSDDEFFDSLPPPTGTKPPQRPSPPPPIEPVEPVVSAAPVPVVQSHANGNDNAEFRVVGLTMNVLNPSYEANADERNRLTDHLLNYTAQRNMMRNETRTLLMTLQPWKVQAYKNLDKAFEYRFDMREAAAYGLIPDKPFEVEQNLKATYLSALENARDEERDVLIARYILVLEQVNLQIPDFADSPADNAREIVDRILGEFASYDQFEEYQDLPLTKESLKDFFDAWIETEFLELAGGNVLGGDVHDFYEEVIETAPVADMLDWLAAFIAKKEANFPDMDGARVALQQIEQRIRTIVTGTANGREPTLDALDRNRLLPTVDQYVRKYKQALEMVIDLEFALHGIPVSPEYQSIDPAQAVTAQEAIMRRISGDRIAKTVRLARLGFTAETITQEISIRIRNLEARLKKLDACIQVPLAVERHTSERAPEILRAALEGQTDEARAALTDVPHTFRWYHNGELIRVRQIEAGRVPQDELSISVFSRVTAGNYHCTVERAGTVFTSDRALLRVLATCARDGATFDVLATRDFTECAWRTHPINDSMAAYRRSQVLTSLAQGLALRLGPDSGLDYQPIYDDSLLDASGAVILSDTGLLALTNESEGALRGRLSFVGALQRLDAGLRYGIGMRYSDQVATIILEDLADEHPVPILAFLRIASRMTPLDSETAVQNIVQRAGPALQQQLDTVGNALQDWAEQAALPQVEPLSPDAVAALARAQTVYDVPVLASARLILDAGLLAPVRSVLGQADARLLREIVARVETELQEHAHSKTFVDQIRYGPATGSSVSELLSEREAELRHRYETASEGQLVSLSHNPNITLDTRAIERAQDRIKRAAERAAHVTYVRGQYHYLDQRECRDAQLNLYENAGAPLGVPLRLWLNGQASSREVSGVSDADWQGVHNEASDQPTVYQVTYGADGQASIIRGSERLSTGYDFRGLHRRIVELVELHNKLPAGAQQAARQKIDMLVLVYNAIAQFAPKLEGGVLVEAREIEQRVRALLA